MSSYMEWTTTEQMMEKPPVRNLILIAGKDGVGKSNALVSQAKLVEELTPDATCYAIDTENKLESALRSWGKNAPRNVRLIKAPSMNVVTAATREVLKSHKRGDWLLFESVARAWEYSQDLAYKSIAGITKVEWLELDEGKRTPTGQTKKGSPIPSPDDFWPIAKGAMESEFFNHLIQTETLNSIFSTTVKPPRQEGFIKESRDRKAIRVELGIDVGLDGPPRLPYYYETMCLLEMVGGQVTCRVLRDNHSTNDNPRQEFEVPDKTSWAMMFMANCRS